MSQVTEPATLSGYGHPSYAASLAEFGTPRRLRRSGGWVLERRIAGTEARDAMGCYPLFVCQDWRALEADLDELDGLVSLALVSDPFGDYDEDVLRRCFRDVLVPFKPHFVTDVSRPIGEIFCCASKAPTIWLTVSPTGESSATCRVRCLTRRTPGGRARLPHSRNIRWNIIWPISATVMTSWPNSQLLLE